MGTRLLNAVSAFSLMVLPAAASSIVPDQWYQFSFYQVGVAAQGCAPNDPNGLNCIPSSGNNSQFLPAGPWSFTASSNEVLTVTDAFTYGDAFSVYNVQSGTPVLIGNTPAASNPVAGCGDNPVDCLEDPLSSHASFDLSPGSYSIVITPYEVAFGGSGYFELSTAAVSVPEPSSFVFWLLLLSSVPFCLYAKKKRLNLVWGLALIAVVLACGSALYALDQAPDGSGLGTNKTSAGDYAFPPAVNKNVLAGEATEIKGRVFYPMTIADKAPIIIILHGNHSTCGRPFNPRTDPANLPGNPHIDDRWDYTRLGACPNPYTEVLSYRGYDYLATRLASWGYVVASIDANLGINMEGGRSGDPSLIKARGRLILETLRRLSLWNKNGGSKGMIGIDLKGKLDFENVGLIGHSRGGEAVRTVSLIYNAKNSPWPNRIPDAVTIKGVFEIAPVDGDTKIDGAFIDANGLAWNVLLPFCDGDVADLAGMRPYDRMLLNLTENPAAQKSTYQVYGTNHNFYNTEWQISDTYAKNGPSCRGDGNNALFPNSPGSPEQRWTALSSVVAFMRANVGAGADPSFNLDFNTLYSIPGKVIDETGAMQNYPTLVFRDFTPSPAYMKVMDDFDKAFGTSSAGVANNFGSLLNTGNGSAPNHSGRQRAAHFAWDQTKAAPGAASPFLQTNWTGPKDNGIDISDFQTLDFRVSRQANNAKNAANKTTDFSIAIVAANGITTGSVLLSSYTTLRGPVGGFNAFHPLLQTVRIKLSDFKNIEKVWKDVRGVLFTFDQTNAAALYLGNVRFSSELGSGVPANAPQEDAQPTAATLSQPQPTAASVAGDVVIDETPVTHTGSILSIQNVASSVALDGNPGVAITIFCADGFPGRDALLEVAIGSSEFDLTSYVNGDLFTIVVTLTPEVFAALQQGDPVSAHYNADPNAEVWTLGYLDKTMLH